MTQLDALLGTISKDGVELELGSGLNFTGSVAITRNTVTGKLDIAISGGGGSAHTIENNGAAITQRTSLNFVGFTTSDVGGKSTVALPLINLAIGVTGFLGAASINDNTLGLDKLTTSVESRLIGRGQGGGTGDLEGINPVGSGLEMSGTTLRRSALTGAVSAAAGSNTTAFASGNFAALTLKTTGPLELKSGTIAATGDIRTGNAFVFTARNSAGSVDTNLWSWDGTVPKITLGSGNTGGISGYINLLSGGIELCAGTNAQLTILAAGVQFNHNAVGWDAARTGPTLAQANAPGSSAVGAKTTIHAQDSTGSTSTGGAFDLAPGAGTLVGGLARLMSGGATPGGGAARFEWNDTGIGFGVTPIAKPAVTGSRGGNAALASLLTALANLGLITDSSSA